MVVVNSESVPSASLVNGLFKIELLAKVMENGKLNGKVEYDGVNIVKDYLDCTQR